MRISCRRDRLRLRLQAGFTLLELLVALAIFAIIATAAYSGLQNVLFTSGIVETEAQRLAQLQTAFLLLERDMEQLANRGIRDEFGQARPPIEGGEINSDALITFTRAGWANPLRSNRSTLQRLSYQLRESRLVRRYWDTLDRGGRSEPRETPLLDKIEQAEIRFLDQQNNWQQDWPPPGSYNTPARLPRAVEIDLTLSDWGRIKRLFRLPAL